jgi:hypothetical protein
MLCDYALRLCSPDYLHTGRVLLARMLLLPHAALHPLHRANIFTPLTFSRLTAATAPAALRPCSPKDPDIQARSCRHPPSSRHLGRQCLQHWRKATMAHVHLSSSAGATPPRPARPRAASPPQFLCIPALEVLGTTRPKPRHPNRPCVRVRTSRNAPARRRLHGSLARSREIGRLPVPWRPP